MLQPGRHRQTRNVYKCPLWHRTSELWQPFQGALNPTRIVIVQRSWWASANEAHIVGRRWAQATEYSDGPRHCQQLLVNPHGVAKGAGAVGALRVLTRRTSSMGAERR